MMELSEKTLMPLGFVISLLVFVAYGVGYTKQVDANTARVIKLEENQDRYSEQFLQIYIKLSAIEGILKEKDNGKTRHRSN